MNKPHKSISVQEMACQHATSCYQQIHQHISKSISRKQNNAKFWIFSWHCQKKIFSRQFELKHSSQYETIGSYQNPMVITTSCASQNFFRLRQSLNTQVKSIWRYKHNDRFKNTIHSWNRTKETNCVTSAQLKILGDHGNSNANFTHA
jgi:hypothetical protein